MLTPHPSSAHNDPLAAARAVMAAGVKAHNALCQLCIQCNAVSADNMHSGQQQLNSAKAASSSRGYGIMAWDAPRPHGPY
jgi:hypothetical protein